MLNFLFLHSRAIKYFLDFLYCPIQKTALNFDVFLVVAFTKVFIHASISIYTVELHKRTPNLIHFFFPQNNVDFEVMKK